MSGPFVSDRSLVIADNGNRGVITGSDGSATLAAAIRCTRADDRVENSGIVGARHVAVDRLRADHKRRHRVACLMQMMHVYVCSLARRQRVMDSSGIANSLAIGVAHERALDKSRHQAES